MFFGKAGDGVDIERIAERVGDHDGAGFRAQRFVEHACVDVVGVEPHIDKHGCEAVLDYGVHRCGESCGDGYDFVAGPKLAIAHLVRCESR